MNYYMGKMLTEHRQRDGIRREQQRQLAKIALSCCVRVTKSVFERIKSALKTTPVSVCCVDTA